MKREEAKALPYDKPKAVLFHKSVKSPQRPTHHHEYHQNHQASMEEEKEEKPSTELTLAATSSAPQSQCPPEDIVWTTLTLGLPSSTSEKREAVDQNPAPSMKKGPWEIKKRLTTSDLGNRCKLLGRSLVEKHVMPCLDEEFGQRVSSREGARVIVHDCDTNSNHQLILKYYKSSDSYVFGRKWGSL
ncbi:unnamed protein product [Prunus armeniaca]